MIPPDVQIPCLQCGDSILLWRNGSGYSSYWSGLEVALRLGCKGIGYKVFISSPPQVYPSHTLFQFTPLIPYYNTTHKTFYQLNFHQSTSIHPSIHQQLHPSAIMSGLINKVKEKIAEVKAEHSSSSSNTTAGPHSSNMANKADVSF